MTQTNSPAQLIPYLAACLLGSWAPTARAQTPLSPVPLSAPAAADAQLNTAEEDSANPVLWKK